MRATNNLVMCAIKLDAFVVEGEAELICLDLMGGAGYNPTAFLLGVDL